MKISEKLAHASNYTKTTGTRAIKYIVIHYTGNNGDTAEGNCTYFAGANRGASAHYFVDENEVWRSVRDNDRAWHCGAKTYKHPECRNTNSIGIELCSRKDAAGKYFFDPATVKLAAELVRAKMAEYGIPADRVIRHYDVVEKNCPEPYVRDAAAWQAFRAAISEPKGGEDVKTYETIKDVPEWARQTIQKLVTAGALSGDGNGKIDVTHDMCRVFVVLEKMGAI